MLKHFFSSSSPFKPSPAQVLFSYILLGIWSFVVLFPLYWLVVTTFKDPIDVDSGPKYVPFVDFQPSTRSFDEVFAQGVTVTRPYTNTIIVGVSSALIALVFGAMASYALTRFQYRPTFAMIGFFIVCTIGVIVAIALGVPWWLAVIVGIAVFLLLAQTIAKRFERGLANDDIAFWLISQRMLPPVAVIIPIYVLFQAFGLLDTQIALIITYSAVNLPIVIWFMRDYFLTIPYEIEESAFIDGASRLQVFWKIILPLSVPGLIATFLIVLVFTWNEYIIAVFLTKGAAQTMPLLIVAQNATRGPQWWNISLLVLLMIGPIIVMAIILERFIARGILIGAVKG